jgi:hypothetical protein
MMEVAKPPAISQDAVETLRQVNDDLRAALIRLRLDGSTAGPQDFWDLLGQLHRASECTRRRPHCEAVAFDEELLEYGRNLERLKNLLPEVHERLLAEKSRLETARNHATAATAWARASKETL